MKQEEEPITGLPENAFRELKPGEVYNPLMSPDKKYSEVNAWSVTWGIADGHPLFGRSRLSGAEGRTSIRSRHPHRHHCRRRIGCRQTQKRIGRKRHYPVYRCQLRRHRGRCHLHPSRTLYSPRNLSRKKSPSPLHKSLSAPCWEVCWVFSSLSPSANIS